jgi:hypothetical protein
VNINRIKKSIFERFAKARSAVLSPYLLHNKKKNSKEEERVLSKIDIFTVPPLYYYFNLTYKLNKIN